MEFEAVPVVVGVLVVILAVAARWWLTRNRRSPTSVPKTVDWVIVGAGPAGCSAADVIRSNHPADTMVVVEQGYQETGSKLKFMTFLSDLLGSSLDVGIDVPSPFDQSKTRRIPCGKGIGGTTLLDWAVHFPTEGGSDTGIGESDVSLSTGRNPLSWAFAESCAAEGYVKVLPERVDAIDRQETEFVLPLWLRIDGKTGFKVNPWHEKLVRQRIPTAEGWKVEAIDEKSNVAAVSMISSIGVARVEARKGVILCGGNFGTAAILKMPRNAGFDTISVPLIYQVLPGLSNDNVNVRTTLNYLRWILGIRSTMQNSIADTLLHSDAMELGSRLCCCPTVVLIGKHFSVHNALPLSVCSKRR